MRSHSLLLSSARLVRAAAGFLVLPVALVALLGACTGPDRPVDRVAQLAEGALGPYSGAVASGDFVFVSGKIGERGQSFEHEVETALDRVEEELARAGLTFADVVDAMVLLTDIGQYADFNAIYARRLSEPYPARACYQVAALPGEARVEIKVTARRR